MQFQCTIRNGKSAESATVSEPSHTHYTPSAPNLIMYCMNLLPWEWLPYIMIIYYYYTTQCLTIRTLARA